MSTISDTESPAPPPRRWQALTLVVLGLGLYLLIYLYKWWPESVPVLPVFMGSMWGPLLCTLILGVWWLVVGPASWRTRLGSLGLAALVIAGAFLAADPGARFFLTMQAVPLAAAVVTLFLCFFWRQPLGVRVSGALLLGVLAFVPWELIRVEGVTGQFGMDASWRWRPTAEQDVARFEEGKKAGPPAGEVAMAGEGDWTGFRGPRRDGIVAGVSLGDWKTPPKEMWRRPVGPGWSSLCVVGDRIFTQEQRGDEELVVCYRASTGEQLWATGDRVRYSDLPSGVGPRGTPAFHDGKVYTLGATALLNCLDAATGQQLWGIDLQKTTGVTSPQFGFASSPLIVGNLVIVLPGSATGPRLVAFDLTGKPAWSEGTGAVGYSSPHLASVAGVTQVLAFNSAGLFAHELLSGKELWSFPWVAEDTAPVVTQPMLLPDGLILIGGGRVGIGSRCIKPVRQGETWSVEEVWQTPFSPGFNDFVRSGECLFGLEGGRLACVDAGTGQRRWKDGSYGAGQVLLAGDRLVVQAESGKLALVAASPDGWQELARLPALADKTWNHPVIAGGRLYVRNSREMVCYELPP